MSLSTKQQFGADRNRNGGVFHRRRLRGNGNDEQNKNGDDQTNRKENKKLFMNYHVDFYFGLKLAHNVHDPCGPSHTVIL